MIPYSTQSIDKNDIKSVSKILKSQFLTQGPINEKFEDKLSKKFKSKYCLTVNSGTSALHLACLSIGLKKNDLVLTSPISFVATANAVKYTGAEVAFVDVDKSFMINHNDLEKKIIFYKQKFNVLPKAVILVHLAGSPYDLEKIWKLSKKYKFKIIEDASHAVGAKYKNSPIGSCKYSHITTFSFHPVKIITTTEGGAVLTNNKKYYLNMLHARSHGILRKKNQNKFWIYDQKTLGWNFRMNEIQAALGISQLNRLEIFLKSRNKIAIHYKKKLKDLPIDFQYTDKYSSSSWHLFIITLKDHSVRDKLMHYLKEKEIQTNLHYIPIYKHTFQKKNKYINKQIYKNSDLYNKNAISIPIYHGLKKVEQNYIIKNIKNFFKN